MAAIAQVAAHRLIAKALQIRKCGGIGYLMLVSDRVPEATLSQVH